MPLGMLHHAHSRHRKSALREHHAECGTRIYEFQNRNQRRKLRMKWCATRRGKGLTNWKPSGKRKIDCRNDSRPRLAALANTARERGAQTLAVPSKSQNGKKAGPPV